MNKTMKAELMIVMPVYNEQASVRKVVNEWFQEVENWTEDFVFLAINDGSTDGTLKILERLRIQLGERIEIVDQPNSGHGQSCINGYRIARDRGIPYVFQIDSDGQCDPQYFFKFWRERENFDVIYGKRVRRDDGWRRVVASKVLWATLIVFGGVNCVDANVPYRLMKIRSIAHYLEKVPRDFFLANVALAILLSRDKSIKAGAVLIHFRERYGGEPSVRMSKFGNKAFELIEQIKRIG
jgi:dolichol-phosphate mannosyltransferase